MAKQEEMGARPVDPLVRAVYASGDTVLWQKSYADGRPNEYHCVVGGRPVVLRTLTDYRALVEVGMQLAFAWE